MQKCKNQFPGWGPRPKTGVRQTDLRCELGRCRLGVRLWTVQTKQIWMPNVWLNRPCTDRTTDQSEPTLSQTTPVVINFAIYKNNNTLRCQSKNFRSLAFRSFVFTRVRFRFARFALARFPFARFYRRSFCSAHFPLANFALARFLLVRFWFPRFALAHFSRACSIFSVSPVIRANPHLSYLCPLSFAFRCSFICLSISFFSAIIAALVCDPLNQVRFLWSSVMHQL